MNIEEKLEVHDCPLCDGGALLEEEGGCGYYVMCLDVDPVRNRLTSILKKSVSKQRKRLQIYGMPVR